MSWVADEWTMGALVRLLVREDEPQFTRARRLIQRRAARGAPVLITSLDEGKRSSNDFSMDRARFARFRQGEGSRELPLSRILTIL